MPVAWRVWYATRGADGRPVTFSSRDGRPEDAPKFQVVACVTRDTTRDSGWYPSLVEHGTRYFLWEPTERQWWSADWLGLQQFLQKHPNGIWLQGVWGRDSTEYGEIRQRALTTGAKTAKANIPWLGDK